MNLMQIPTTLNLTIRLPSNQYGKKVTVNNLDLDLLQQQIQRLTATHGSDTPIVCEDLKFDFANVRSSLFIKTLGELQGFIDGLVKYDKNNANTHEHSIAEYVGCYELYYREIRADLIGGSVGTFIMGSATAYNLRDLKTKLSAKNSYNVGGIWHAIY